MKRLLLLAAVCFAAWMSPAWSQSFYGYATVNANLRAGPDAGYPRVATVPAGARLQIFGCVDGWYWCDVQWGPERGWISSALIAAEFGGGRVIVYEHGPQLGLPFVTFAFDLYWDNYYRNRYWYRERTRWNHYRPPPYSGRPPGYRPPHHNPPPVHRPPSNRPPPSSGRPPSHGKPPSSGRPPSGKPPPSTGRPPPQTKPPATKPPPSTRPPSGKPVPRDDGKPPSRDGDKP
jgi:uncharacterized protein YraI